MRLRRSSPAVTDAAAADAAERETPGRLSVPGPRTALVAVYAGALGLVAFAYVVARVTDRPFADLSKDPVSVLGHAPVYIGFLSNVAVILWAATAAACLVAGVTLRFLRDPYAAPLIAAGLISAIFAWDDAFLVHERVGPRLGIPQSAFMAVYGLALILAFLRYRELLRRTDLRVLAAAAVLFAASVVIDFFGDRNDFARSAQLEPFDDTAKLLGIVTWTAYFARLAVVSLLATAAGSTPADPVPIEVVQAAADDRARSGGSGPAGARGARTQPIGSASPPDATGR